MENQQRWADLLLSAITEPGMISKAYSAFHNYSMGNQLAALSQCWGRGIQPGIINTYQGWQGLKRQVKKGEKALELCMPYTGKRTNEAGEDQHFIVAFVWKSRWFVLSQTEGPEITPPVIPGWSKEWALSALNITEIDFEKTTGNTQGYARDRQIAISQLAEMPHKTTFHELAHVVLGHTAESNFQESQTTCRSLREVEAESVALLLCESLELPGAAYSRGYIQHWLEGEAIPEKSAQRIFGAADKILKAGRAPQTTTETEEKK